jgi:uncharacterized protein (TIGR03000 family)
MTGVILLTASVGACFGQWPNGMGFRGPAYGTSGALPPGVIGGGYGQRGGYVPYVGVYMPYAGGYYNGYGGYDPNVASVPSAAYFTYGNTSYTTESPSPIPVYSPRTPFAPMPPALPLTALLQVHVPADAEVWLEGQKMRSTCLRRHYRSPPLDPVKGYAYEVRARWQHDGKPIEDVRHVAIRAGATVLVDFTHVDPIIQRPSAPPEAPKPPKGGEATPAEGADKASR